MKKSNPVIVIAAYNRSDSISRLLKSLSYSKGIDGAKLVISIDNQEPNNYDVKEIADSFVWPFGEKEVRYQPVHLGLRKHILKCGDLALEFGSVIVLEDDLVVSPYFYNFGSQAADFYQNDLRIGGISLYNQPRQETVNLPFNPLIENSDVYFAQFPSSLGQLWTKNQWESFMLWYDSNQDISEIQIPRNVLSWPETSWKKYFAAYLKDTDKYFVYPNTSFTTNFFDDGTHLTGSISHRGQSPLNLFGYQFHFQEFSESPCVYDSSFEIESRCINMLSVTKLDYDFEMDLYGSKEIEKISTQYVITSRPCNNPIMSFKRALKPHEVNIIMDLEGEDFSLCDKKDVIIRKQNSEELWSEFNYFYTSHIKGLRFILYRYLKVYKLLSRLLK